MTKKVRQMFFQLRFFQILFLCTLFLTSCERTPLSSILPDKTSTIKYASILRSSECNWMDATELDSNTNVAIASMQKTDDIVNNIVNGDFSDLVKKTDFANEAPIYPSIEGFGSLDISELSDDFLQKINKFIDFINSNNFSKLQVSAQKEYLRALAKYRLDECRPVEESVIGKPTIGSDIISVPLLLQTVSKQYIVVLFYKKDVEEWKFNKFNVSVFADVATDTKTKESVDKNEN